MAVCLYLFLLGLVYFLCPHESHAVTTCPKQNNYSYMKSVRSASDMPHTEEYDYIVVGGGTAGCPLAATLSKKYSVLVLERGDVPKYQSNATSLAAHFSNILSGNRSPNAALQWFVSEDGVPNVRGKILGGSSMINTGFYSRGDEEFFVKSGVEWDFGEVEKAYEWVEEQIVLRPRLGVWQSAVKEAMLEAGVEPGNGFSLNHEIGTKVSGSTFGEYGERHGADQLLNGGDLKNLRVAVGATVERIIFNTDGLNASAIGVIYIDFKGISHRALIRNKGEVILCAGAIGSPQLLLLSGIGHYSSLSSLRIPIVYHQPNVGKFMFDNPRTEVNVVVPLPIELSPVQVVAITKDYYIESVSFTQPYSPTRPPTNMGTITEKIPGPFSSGSLWLTKPADAKSNPKVRFNYFADRRDLSRCVKAVRKMGQMLSTKSMAKFRVKDSKGGKGFLFYGQPLPVNQSDDSSMETFCRRAVKTMSHYHGGCLVGKVVDGDFRVLGIDSLRVVDGSTFALAPGTNPQATVMMLGRYTGLKMIRERRKLM